MKKSILFATLIPFSVMSQPKTWSELTKGDLFSIDPNIEFQIECKIGKSVWKSKSSEEQYSIKEEFYNSGEYYHYTYGADELAQMIWVNYMPVARLNHVDTYSVMKDLYDQDFYCLDALEDVRKDLEMLRSNDQKCVTRGFTRYSYNNQGCVNNRRR